MPYVYAHVDVDLNEFDTDDLISEINKRGKEVVTETDFDPEVTVNQIFDAFYVGNAPKATELARQYVQNATGRVLP